ncbi:hypothetical protein EXN32_21170, partial [Agrobacterium tumefaciens]|uniref:LysR substrate-binding domain-containing protein n=3 Tax=Rhizobium/Agrobacterium group TaxID=227290 RepID=UPI0011698979
HEGEKQELDLYTRPETYLKGGSNLGGNTGSVLSGNQQSELRQQIYTSTEEPLDLCLMQAPCIYRQAALEALLRTNTNHREVMTGNSVQSVRSAVISGLGISVLGASCLGAGLRPSRRMHDLEALPLATISLHGRDHRKDDVVTVMREVLADHLRSDLPLNFPPEAINA